MDSSPQLPPTPPAPQNVPVSRGWRLPTVNLPPRARQIAWNLLFALIVVLAPVFLSLTAVRLVLNGWFVEFEYRTPNFPADPYGFSMQERLKYAHVAVDYLINDAGIEFLGDLRFPAGQMTPPESCRYMDDCTRFYNDRELRHMLDVKILVQAVLRLWVVAGVLLVLLGVLAWRGGWEAFFRRAVSWGGWVTLGLIAAILLGVALVFDPLFILFHRIFFTGETWLFLASDTLIRLFPERFWMDTFTMVGGLTAVMALAAGWFFRLEKKGKAGKR